ncbi:MAG: cation transporter [Acidimicrobiia bacterium]
MINQTLSVPDISCDHCKMSIEGALRLVTGIETAQVNIPAKTVALSFDESAVSLDRIIGVIGDVGYEVAR